MPLHARTPLRRRLTFLAPYLHLHLRLGLQLHPQLVNELLLLRQLSLQRRDFPREARVFVVVVVAGFAGALGGRGFGCGGGGVVPCGEGLVRVLGGGVEGRERVLRGQRGGEGEVEGLSVVEVGSLRWGLGLGLWDRVEGLEVRRGMWLWLCLCWW